jgi:hypothetical protein
MNHEGGVRPGLFVLLAVVLVATTGAAQADPPAWEDTLFEDMERAADEFNARGGFHESGTLEAWLLRSARINLYVHGDDSTVTYSFRIDERLHVTSLQRGEGSDPTYRVQTSRQTVEEIIAAENKDAAIRSGIQTGTIRVQRVVHLFGFEIAVGIAEVGIALAGIVVGVFAVAKFGLGGLFSLLVRALQQAIQFLQGAAQTLWQSLPGIATGLTILEQLGLLDRLKRAIDRLWNAIARKVAAIRDWAGRSSSTTEEDEQ